MKLLIENSFCNILENQEELDYVVSIYNKYTVSYAVGYRFKICVLEQKINLDEEDINELFDIWPELPIRYANLGGRGCRFSLAVNYINRNVEDLHNE